MIFWCLSPTIAKMILYLVLENISLKFNGTIIAFGTSYYSNSKIELRFAKLSFCRFYVTKIHVLQWLEKDTKILEK